MKSYQQTDNLTESALRAGVERKTARKYAVEGSPGPDEPRPARHWRTRPDGFADIWPEVEAQLGREPQLEAKVLFEEVLERHGGRVTGRHPAPAAHRRATRARLEAPTRGRRGVVL